MVGKILVSLKETYRSTRSTRSTRNDTKGYNCWSKFLQEQLQDIFPQVNAELYARRRMRVFREYEEQHIKNAKMDFTTALHLTSLKPEDKKIWLDIAQTTMITISDTKKGDNGMCAFLVQY